MKDMQRQRLPNTSNPPRRADYRFGYLRPAEPRGSHRQLHLCDGARGTCLPARFPENREFNREFAKIHGFLAMQCLEQASLFNGLAVNSLLAPEQGICERGTGNCFGGTGNLSRGTGKFLDWMLAAPRRIAQGETSQTPPGKVRLASPQALSSVMVIRPDPMAVAFDCVHLARLG